MLQNQLDEMIDSQKENILADILKLISFASVNGHQQETQACLRHYLSLAESMGFHTMHTSNWDVGIVEMGAGDETLGILVHLDVVEIGDRNKWTNDPFCGTIRDGFIWGRGAEDDKGAAIMSLYAMQAVLQLGLPMHRKVWLIVGTSEESRWTDIESYKREFPVPDFGFSPDGEFPIFNREKGFAEIVLDFERDGSRGIQYLIGGDSPNTIPSRAEITLQNGRRVVVSGIACHSSTPEEGENAILNLCHELKDECFDFSQFTNQFLAGDIYASALQIDDGCETFQGEEIGLTTVAPTLISLTDQGVRLTINIRQKYGTSIKDIQEAFTKHAIEFGYKIKVNDHLDPMWVSRDLPFLATMKEVAREYGMDDQFKLAAGTSYAKSMKNFVLWGPVFEGDPMTAHVEDERISVKSVMLATKIYARFISRMVLESSN